MNRKYVHRGTPVPGTYQRCADSCPADGCRRGHSWFYLVELPSSGGGRRQFKKGGFASGKDAAEARAEILLRERDGTLPVSDKTTVGDWLVRWLEIQKDVRELGEGTLVDYRRHVRSYWIPAVGRLKLVDLRPHHVTDTLAGIRRLRNADRARAQAHNDAARADAAERDEIRKARSLKRPVKPGLVVVPRAFGPGTAQRVHATLRAALNAAVRAELVTRNVAAQAEKPTYRRKRVRPWEPEQLGAWLDSISDERLYALYHLGAFAGMRRGELCGLGWDDVDLDKGRITVRWQITGVSYAASRRAIKQGNAPKFRTRPKTRDGEERIIDLDPGSVDVLRAWRKRQYEERELWGDAYDDTDDLVFTREDGRPLDPNQVYQRFVASVNRLGFKPVPLHLLRHCAASLLIAAGIDIAVISKRLGHSKIDLTVDTYGHLIGKIGKKAAKRAAAQVPRRNRKAEGRRKKGHREQ